MRRSDRRSTQPPKPSTAHPQPEQQERPAGEQSMTPELWLRVQQAIRRLTSITR